jgi:hypothetical protein
MEFDQIIRGFSQEFGIEGLEPDDEGSVRLDIDGMTVEVLHDAAAGRIMLCAEIGEPPPEGSDRFAAVLLRANFLFQGTDGATMAQNPETKNYALILPLELAALDVSGFSERLGKFVDGIERWRQMLADFRDADDAAEEEGASGIPPLAQSGFMAV